MRYLIVILLLGTSVLSQAQEGLANPKEMLVKNKVKSCIVATCYGGCHREYFKYDKRGNEIYYDFGRTGTAYQSEYDENDNYLGVYWINKSKDSVVNFIPAEPEEQYAPFEIVRYENEGRKETIIKNDSIRVVKEFDENCNMLSSKMLKYGKEISLTTFEYDSRQRLLRRVRAYENYIGEIETRIVRFVYDNKGRVIEYQKVFFDPCMGIDEDDYIYRLEYFDNDLIRSAEAFQEGKIVPTFSLEYSYEFY